MESEGLTRNKFIMNHAVFANIHSCSSDCFLASNFDSKVKYVH